MFTAFNAVIKKAPLHNWFLSLNVLMLETALTCISNQN